MNTRKILTRAAVTGALVAIPLVAVTGTASADPLWSDRDDRDHSAPQYQQNQQPDQFRLPELFPQAPAPQLQNPAPNVVPFDFFQGYQLPSTGSAF
ncbi:hypothetical protein CH306_15190 [Rhodococcus sp. 15-725-2-2b]|uniref:hypothetical protein n=1 Tax=unclassified Rhodococcus (in: high G+C Gram-positive bacteria) TaxID=192944 RepID=UPI0005D75C31|nr:MULTISPECIES: hypothetical protein [unclassified Rhodococcus (in: high G+C Gram-positive bacteria)]AJW43067.1 hypothetical protein NY08_5073 [Rhodococcus sp. B7740]OZC66285.1 hypothetical protein CH277_14965 [Rhodococcus sp. 06-469-3-2]OZC76457.1 hypothetical protein CH251_06020 [Rhodococcus sp. 06-462-5]OZD44931.1 hypothetical protein CH264_10850 [Rhodococcus sp. 06-1477-1A]OZE64514.1 hypothetical protein CH270_15760 [Rhodococcus sp. 02-925g]